MIKETEPQTSTAFALTGTTDGKCMNHPWRKEYSRHRCNSCYRIWRLQHKKERASCHPDRAHVAKGKCRNCYKALCDKRLPKERLQKRWRKAMLKHQYGITQEQCLDMWEAQGRKCLICSSEISFSKGKGRSACVDHDHNTGTVRGLLCPKCNTSLGFFERFHKEAAAYLRRWGWQA